MMSMNWNYPTTIWFGDQRINEIQKACESLNIHKAINCD
jgi:alcohol dehydrogenase class IV